MTQPSTNVEPTIERPGEISRPLTELVIGTGIGPGNETLTDASVRAREDTPPIQRAPKYSSDFEAFWKAYPGNNGIKLKAFQQWQRLRPFDREAAAEALPAWIACQRWREGYVIHCERWLRDRMWEQDPPVDLKATAPSRNGNATISDQLDQWTEAIKRGEL